ncbi:unnamed protein product [Rangifer tarandus platyrhynchus]|uniref:Uncharacterized protein n=1 Tax=Rangifer tarandus platyrhynchus TaxID=3082113 RepID=A0ABN8YH78_RANTA|nr:unnamed protein product [Rangifer tarandus platyrhynchus]
MSPGPAPAGERGVPDIIVCREDRTGWGERDTFPSAVTWEPHRQPCPSPRHGTPKHPHDGAVLRPPASGVHRAHVSAADPSSRSPEEAASAGSDAELTLRPGAHRAGAGKASLGDPRRTPVVHVRSLSQACRGEEAAKDSGEREAPIGQHCPLPQGSLPVVGVQTGRGAPRVPENPGDQRQARASCAGDAQAPQGRSTATPGTLRLRHPTLKPPSPARSPQGSGEPCVLQAARGLHRKAFAFGWLFPRNWGVSCAGLVLSWLRPDGTRALPAGPARVPVAFGAWGGLRPLEPAQKDQSAPFPNHLSPHSPRARLPNSLSCKYPSPRPSGRQT